MPERIDPRSPTPIYAQQIAERVRVAVAAENSMKEITSRPCAL